MSNSKMLSNGVDAMKQGYFPNLSAAIQLGVFLFLWVFSAFLIPLSIYLLFAFRSPYLFLLLVAYYGYRAIYPAQNWHDFHAGNCSRRVQNQYFQRQELVLEEGVKFEKNSKSLFCWAPHGILCLGWSLNGSCTRQFLDIGIQWLAADMLLKLPFISDYLKWSHTAPASKENMLSLLKSGSNFALIPGGFEEATIFQRSKHRIFIKERAGFIKYALMYGYRIFPVYTFGEEETYNTLTSFLGFRMWLNRFKIPGVFFWGKFASFMPDYNAHIVSVVGKPLELPHIPNPTTEDVKKWHTAYIETVKQLFETHKGKYAMQPNAVLEIY